MSINIFFPFHGSFAKLISRNRDVSSSRRSLVLNIVLSLIICAVGYLLNYFFNVFLSRLLLPEFYGDYAASVAVLQFGIVFVLLGSDAAIMKYIPSYIKGKKWGKVRGYLVENEHRLFYRGLIVFFLGIGIAVGLLFIPLNQTLSELVHPSLFFFWSIPLLVVMVFFSTLLRSLQRFFLDLFQNRNILYLFLFSCLMITHWIYKQQLDTYHALFTYVFAIFLFVFFQFTTFIFSLPKEVKSAKAIYPNRTWVRIALELLLSAILINNVSSLFLILLEMFGTNEDNVGAYSAILVICNVLWLAYSATMSIVTPSISSLVQQRETKNVLQKLMNTVSLTMALINGFIAIIILVFGKLLLSHFHASYIAHYPVLVLVVISAFFVNCFGVVFPVLQYSGMQRTLIKVSANLFLPMIIISSILIHYFDINGAATAFMLTALAYIIACGILVKKELQLKLFFFF